MITKDLFNNFLDKYVNYDGRNEFIKNNRLLFIFGNSDMSTYQFNLHLKVNKAKELLRRKEMCRIDKLLKSSGINVIHFKGSILADQLYEPSYLRMVGDMDFCVSKENYASALEILFNDGYQIADSDEPTDHHTILSKNANIIELHCQFITPHLEIKEEEFYNHIIEYPLDGYIYHTFDKTAALLHLLYHAYTDVIVGILEFRKLFFFSTGMAYRKGSLTSKRYYRYFEIALFIEKFYNEIDWDVIYDNIQQQTLNDGFKEVMFDINCIFPGFLPEKLCELVFKKKQYTLTPIMAVFPEYYEYKYKTKILNTTEMLPGFIDSTWKNAKTFDFSKNKCSDTVSKQILSCNKNNIEINYCINVCNGILSVYVETTDTDPVFSNGGKVEPLHTDCVNIVAVSTQEQYSFKVIYFVPEIKDDLLTVACYDTENGTTDISDIADAKIEKTESGYSVSVQLPLEYLRINKKENGYFYFDLVVHDCDSATNERRSVTSIVTDKNTYDDPRYYVKVIF